MFGQKSRKNNTIIASNVFYIKKDEKDNPEIAFNVLYVYKETFQVSKKKKCLLKPLKR